MEFIKMVTITLYAKQKKRHRCIEQTFRLHYFLDGDNNYGFFGDAYSYGSHFLFLG